MRRGAQMRKRARTQEKKLAKPVFRIYTEGKKTEVNYVKSYIIEYLKQQGYLGHNIIINQPSDHSPYGLLKAARNDTDGAQNDIIWLVFDCDKHDNKAKTFSESSAIGINIAYSSICFETWILLHFVYSTKAYSSCDEIKRDLNKHFPQGYDKAITNIFTLAAGDNLARLNVARNHAKKICEWAHGANPGQKIWQFNPYTNVHELLDDIDDYIAKNRTS